MRARNIKPSFFKNAELADAGSAAQLLFVGLWCLADRDGRIKDQPRVIKAELFPYYDLDVNRELTVIERLGFIRRYVSGGIGVIEVVNFKKHQSPHHTEKKSELPPWDAGATPCLREAHEINGALTVNTPCKDGGNPSDSLIPDSLNHDSLIGQHQRAAPRKRGSRLPDDWTPSESEVAYAKARGLDPHAVAEKFRNYWHAKAGNGATKLDWSATWRNWCITEAERQPRKSAPKVERAPTPAEISAARAAAAAANQAGAIARGVANILKPVPRG